MDYQNPNGVSAGGCIFQLVDGWFKRPGDLWTAAVAQHNPNPGPNNSGFPDNQADEEYFGLFERVPMTPIFDRYNPRAAAGVTQQKFNQTW